MLGKSREVAEAELQKAGKSPEQIARTLPHMVRQPVAGLGSFSVNHA